MAGMAGMHGGMPEEVPQYNVIKPDAGKNAYARVSAGMYNELFYTQASKSGLMTVGAQHGVSQDFLQNFFVPTPAADCI
jgi:hypothetical protein